LAAKDLKVEIRSYPERLAAINVDPWYLTKIQAHTIDLAT
jgi:hypothetical protein